MVLVVGEFDDVVGEFDDVVGDKVETKYEFARGRAFKVEAIGECKDKGEEEVNDREEIFDCF